MILVLVLGYLLAIVLCQRPIHSNEFYGSDTTQQVSNTPIQDESNHPDTQSIPSRVQRGRISHNVDTSFLNSDESSGAPELYSSIPGEAGVDYPMFEDIPPTSFSCNGKVESGYYADVETHCQVFHVCQAGGHKNSFLCPNGSIFNQKYSVCDWWYSFDCEAANDLFPLVNDIRKEEYHENNIYQPSYQQNDPNLYFDLSIASSGGNTGEDNHQNINKTKSDHERGSSNSAAKNPNNYNAKTGSRNIYANRKESQRVNQESGQQRKYGGNYNREEQKHSPIASENSYGPNNGEYSQESENGPNSYSKKQLGNYQGARSGNYQRVGNNEHVRPFQAHPRTSTDFSLSKTGKSESYASAVTRNNKPIDSINNEYVNDTAAREVYINDQFVVNNTNAPAGGYTGPKISHDGSNGFSNGKYGPKTFTRVPPSISDLISKQFSGNNNVPKLDDFYGNISPAIDNGFVANGSSTPGN